MQSPISDVLSVSEFNGVIKEVLSSLGVFRVRGEITEFSISQRKGISITLSDGKALLRVGGYAPSVVGLDLVEKGMNVIVEGAADLYAPHGTFSLSAYKIEPEGEGSLAIAYQKLKAKLEAEGLFALEHKQVMPDFVTHIALITAKDSAAFSDFIKILTEHNLSLNIDFYPVIVQGPHSVNSLKNALILANKTKVDCIALVRGGGSLEDLKSFNDEDIARIIFASLIPILAGVGHEKDESIADFVSDVRASTPSQAAYYIVKQNLSFIEKVESLGDEIDQRLMQVLESYNHKLDFGINSLESQVDSIHRRIEDKLATIVRILDSYDVRAVLKRGFAIIEKGRKSIRSISSLKIRDSVDTILYDGKFSSVVHDLKYYPKSSGPKKVT